MFNILDNKTMTGKSIKNKYDNPLNIPDSAATSKKSL